MGYNYTSYMFEVIITLAKMVIITLVSKLMVIITLARFEVIIKLTSLRLAAC